MMIWHVTVTYDQCTETDVQHISFTKMRTASAILLSEFRDLIIGRRRTQHQTCDAYPSIPYPSY